MAYFFLMMVALVFIAACNAQFDWKYSARFFDVEIRLNSIWRKIYPFKEREINPLRYVKWIPVVITFVILIAVLIVYIIYWISPSLLSGFLESKLCGWISLGYLFMYIIYSVVMID